MIEQEKPLRLEWRNIKISYNSRGRSYRMSVEVDKATWDLLETMPDDADGEMVVWWTHRGSEEPSVAKHKLEVVPTPYGQFWRILKINKGFCNHPDCRTWLGVGTPDEAWARLHELFQVQSLSDVSPDRLRDALKEMGMDSLILLVNQAEVKWKEKMAA